MHEPGRRSFLRTGRDAERLNPAFLGTFPDVRQTDGGLRIGVPMLRGVWDRRGFLHDGRAHSLLLVLATPAHPALPPGAVGYNEDNGQSDTHGGTSQLSAAHLRPLRAFIQTP